MRKGALIVENSVELRCAGADPYALEKIGQSARQGEKESARKSAPRNATTNKGVVCSRHIVYRITHFSMARAIFIGCTDSSLIG